MRWVQERLSLEASRANQRIHDQDSSAIPTLSNAAAAAAAAVRRDDSNGAMIKAPAKKKKKKGKQGGNRGKADPRMDRAVEAKEANPDMKPYDALVFGGFVFTQVEGTKQEMVDADNINLKQRRNQLARRLRHNAARRKEAEATAVEAEEGKTPEPPESCGETLATAKTYVSEGNTGAACMQNIQQQQPQQPQQPLHVHAPAGKRRHSADSFDDEINALPGIGDDILADDDDDLASCDSLFGEEDEDNEDDGNGSGA